MNTKKLRSSAFLAFFLALVALIVLSTSTYAWFTFRAYTNVTPLSGTISNGDGDLLISNSVNGPFDISCDLILRDPNAELLPISTADLESFYSVRTQDPAGIATSYAGANDRASNNTLNGTVYLKGEESAFDVYLWMPSVNCGDDVQALAAMRLGLKIQTAKGTETHIFRLDELGNTSGAESHRTIPESNCVVSSINANGEASYVTDVSKLLSTYAASGDTENVIPGENKLCSIDEGEIATVQFWLYLEGCDENCFNSVQGRNIELQIGFAGVANIR